MSFGGPDVDHYWVDKQELCSVLDDTKTSDVIQRLRGLVLNGRVGVVEFRRELTEESTPPRTTVEKVIAETSLRLVKVDNNKEVA